MMRCFLFGCMLLALYALRKRIHRHRCIKRHCSISLQLGDGAGRGFDSRPRVGAGTGAAGSKATLKAQVATANRNSTCICGSGSLYRDCCKLLHDQTTGDEIMLWDVIIKVMCYGNTKVMCFFI